MFDMKCHCFVLTMLLLCGCSGTPDDLPELTPVSGTVTLDGEPLANAAIVFEYQGEGRAVSAAQTDEAGHYELRFGSGNYVGAKIGEHIVRIKTENVTSDAAGNETRTEEKVPPRYNYNSELTLTVSADKAEGYDFNLTSN